MRQGRTLATMPRSTTQTSPGLAAGILGLLLVHLLEHRIGGLVEELRFVALFELSETLQDGGPLLCGQLGKLGNDFRCAHVENLPFPHISSKPYDDWFASVLGRAAA